MLETLPFFTNVEPTLLATLESRSFRVSHAAGAVIIRAGELAKTMFVILSGSVGVWREDRYGALHRVATLTTGECFGEVGLVTGGTRNASITAEEPTELLVISDSLFREFFGSDAELSYRISQAVTNRLDTPVAYAAWV